VCAKRVEGEAFAEVAMEYVLPALVVLGLLSLAIFILPKISGGG
jgi:hypothetical protein